MHFIGIRAPTTASHAVLGHVVMDDPEHTLAPAALASTGRSGYNEVAGTASKIVVDRKILAGIKQGDCTENLPLWPL